MTYVETISRGKEEEKSRLCERQPYAFSGLLAVLFIGINLSVGSVSSLFSYPALVIIAVVMIARMHWWGKVGFAFPKKGQRRSLLLFLPAFLGVLWWVVVAPMVGYGTIQLPDATTIALFAGLTFLIGFEEEVYFRGMMLPFLKSKGLWRAALFTSFLFGAAHSINALYGQSLAYSGLQVAYAFAYGLAFAALFLVTGLVWPLILAHFLTDFSSYLNSAAGTMTSTITQTDYLMTLLIVLVYGSYAIILLTRKWKEPSSNLLYASRENRTPEP